MVWEVPPPPPGETGRGMMSGLSPASSIGPGRSLAARTFRCAFGIICTVCRGHRRLLLSWSRATSGHADPRLDYKRSTLGDHFVRPPGQRRLSERPGHDRPVTRSPAEGPVYGADVVGGQIIGQHYKRCGREFLDFMDRIVKQHRRKDIHVVSIIRPPINRARLVVGAAPERPSPLNPDARTRRSHCLYRIQTEGCR